MTISFSINPAALAEALGVACLDAMSLIGEGRWLSWVAKCRLGEHDVGRVRVLTHNGVNLCRQRELGCDRRRRPDQETFELLLNAGHTWIVDNRRSPQMTAHKLTCGRLIDLVRWNGGPTVPAAAFDEFMADGQGKLV
jgi:hypothetical protein